MSDPCPREEACALPEIKEMKIKTGYHWGLSGWPNPLCDPAFGSRSWGWGAHATGSHLVLFLLNPSDSICGFPLPGAGQELSGPRSLQHGAFMGTFFFFFTLKKKTNNFLVYRLSLPPPAICKWGLCNLSLSRNDIRQRNNYHEFLEAL